VPDFKTTLKHFPPTPKEANLLMNTIQVRTCSH